MADCALIGGIELGGTKTVLAVGRGDGTIVSRHTVPTRPPGDLLPEIVRFFAQQSAGIEALGVGAFGPVVVNRAAPDYGRLLETNKPGWSGFDLIGALEDRFQVDSALVTDVGAAAIGEARLGALQDVELGAYLTVGTGIGGAIVCREELLPAMLHPELGHVTLQRDGGDSAPSTCQFHANCAEGLAAGPAVLTRFGKSLDHFTPADPQFRLIAGYLGQLCANLVLTLSPQRIVLGGGVMQANGLLGEVRAAMVGRLGVYSPPGIRDDAFLCAPALAHDAGIVGALICGGRAQARRLNPDADPTTETRFRPCAKNPANPVDRLAGRG